MKQKIAVNRVIYFVLIILLINISIGTAMPTSVRYLPNNYTDNSTFLVTINVTFDNLDCGGAVAETIPVNWSVKNITGEGNGVIVGGTIRYAPIENILCGGTSNSYILRYYAIVNESNLNATFIGLFSVDGIGYVITGDTFSNYINQTNVTIGINETNVTTGDNSSGGGGNYNSTNVSVGNNLTNVTIGINETNVTIGENQTNITFYNNTNSSFQTDNTFYHNPFITIVGDSFYDIVNSISAGFSIFIIYLSKSLFPLLIMLAIISIIITIIMSIIVPIKHSFNKK